MANPRPTPKPENLRPPWPPGTSGNPAGYSRGRRISDAIERLIEEMALDREFGATAIAMALGKKYMLKRKVKDPETGEEIWVEHKPDIARHLCESLGSDRFAIFGVIPLLLISGLATGPPAGVGDGLRFLSRHCQHICPRSGRFVCSNSAFSRHF